MKFRQAKRLLSRAGWHRTRKSATAHAIWEKAEMLKVAI
jgi:hypothetical protein